MEERFSCFHTFILLDMEILTTPLYFKIVVCHAEMNAIMNKNSADVKNCTIYVALFPCNECAKLIIQSGIKKVCELNFYFCL